MSRCTRTVSQPWCHKCSCFAIVFKSVTPNDPYSGHTAPLTSKRCILYIYSTNIGTEYFKHGIKSPFFSLQNAVCFIILTYLVPILCTFYIQCVLKIKKKNHSGAKRLICDGQEFATALRTESNRLGMNSPDIITISVMRL